MSNLFCSVCHQKIDEYYIKIEGTYYHYSPCCVEKFKTKQANRAPVKVRISEPSDDEPSRDPELSGDAETVDELLESEVTMASCYSAGV
jgi:hypothetical protein